MLAHRFSYELANGPIPEGLQIDHLCRNRGCVRPDHMEAVTPRVNYLRGDSVPAKNARKTECKRGHPFTFQNTLVVERPGFHPSRQCRTCKGMRQLD